MSLSLLCSTDVSPKVVTSVGMLVLDREELFGAQGCRCSGHLGSLGGGYCVSLWGIRHSVTLVSHSLAEHSSRLGHRWPRVIPGHLPRPQHVVYGDSIPWQLAKPLHLPSQALPRGTDG